MLTNKKPTEKRHNNMKAPYSQRDNDVRSVSYGSVVFMPKRNKITESVWNKTATR